MSQPFAAAISQIGPDSDVVITSRVRIARNISGFPFICRASNPVLQEILRVVRRAVDQSPHATASEQGLRWIDLQSTSSRERTLLCERHLVSRNFATSDKPRALAVSTDENSSVMVNEEDHLRIQFLCAGSRLIDAFQSAFKLEQALALALNFSFHQRWGYLTACPTNVGCGIRISAMLHLPGIQIMKETDRIKRAARDLHLAVRGYYGEGSESTGDFFQFSNQNTLGSTEESLLSEFNDVVLPRLIGYERDARTAALARHRTKIEDLVFRAQAALGAARLLSAEAATKDLSRLRFGVIMGLVKTDLAVVQRLLLQVQPAHLSVINPIALEGDDIEREVRATFVRETLAGSNPELK